MQLLSKYPIWLKTHGEFHIFTFFLLQCSLVKEKWHLACPFRLDLVSIHLCAKNYQSIPKVSKVTGIFTVTFWYWHCLCQGKVAFGNSFVWFLSLFICLRNSIKISHMVEAQRQLPYFHIFCFGIAMVKEQAYWLDLVDIYQYAKKYQNVPNGLTLVLLNLDIHCFCKQCRSRSVGFWRSQLIWICTVCHLVFEFIATIWIKQFDWLKIRSGHGILIYSVGQGKFYGHFC